MDIKKCKVEWCIKEARAKGYCLNHYTQISRHGKIGKPKPKRMVHKQCSISECINDYYAKNYCRKHYAKYITNNKRPHYHPCAFKGCQSNAKDKYCYYHQQLLKQSNKYNVPFEKIEATDFQCLAGKKRRKEKNCNWKGGIFAYPNHSEMKRNRKIKLELVNYKCEYCSKYTDKTFHKDRSKTNHAVKNLVVACKKCYYANFPTQSKFRLLYGKSSKELAAIFNVSLTTIFAYHKNGKLQVMINRPANPDSQLKQVSDRKDTQCQQGHYNDPPETTANPCRLQGKGDVSPRVQEVATPALCSLDREDKQVRYRALLKPITGIFPTLRIV